MSSALDVRPSAHNVDNEAAASLYNSARSSEGSQHIQATVSLPRVNVPVLSITIFLTEQLASSASPLLIRIPFLAPIPVPTMMAVGVLKPNAQGQATTITDIQIWRHTANLVTPWR